MGEVFAAENIRTGRHVAIKLLRADSKSKSSAVERFRREARAAGSINSDHVTQVLDVEEDAEHGIVLVFELLEGESLIDRLKRTGPIPFEELYSIIEAVWMGLADAHRVGIIHRDLKPSNVFLEHRPDGQTRVKILDFGISKLPKEMGGETLTEMGQSLGTFSFMPPEQIGKAKTVDHRADIYACSTLIFQAMSGQLPYTARNILVMVDLKSKTDPRKLADAMDRPVEPRLEAFLARGLARDPADRFQSAMEALAAWRELRPTQASSILGSAPSLPPPTPLSRPASSAQSPPVSTTPKSPPRSAPSQASQSAVAPRPSPYGNTTPIPPMAQGSSLPYASSGAGEPASERARIRGGTIAMETTFETTASTAATRAIPIQRALPGPMSEPPQLRPVSPSIMPNQAVRDVPGQRNAHDPRSVASPPSAASGYSDQRSQQHGSYQGSGSYPPPPMHGQGPYSQAGYPAAAATSINDEASKGVPVDQTQPTRVYTPNLSANAQGSMGASPQPSPSMAHIQSSMTPRPIIPGAGQMYGPPNMAALRSQQESGWLRIALWFVAFGVVGFGIVATLHYFFELF